jgi:hypothetical protein
VIHGANEFCSLIIIYGSSNHLAAITEQDAEYFHRHRIHGFIDTHLMSLGMVAESGEEFYAEVQYPDHICSAFVREAVIPLLGRNPNAFLSQ